MSNCPCGSNLPFADCCEPAIKGARPAQTAEQLMRSRYSAYVTVDTDYIFETTHPDHRGDYDPKVTKDWAENSGWAGLRVVAIVAGTASDASTTMSRRCCTTAAGAKG